MARRGWHHFGWSGAEALSVSMRDITGSVWAHDGGLWMQAWRLHLPQWYYQATAIVSSWVKGWNQFEEEKSNLVRGENRQGNQPESFYSNWGLSWIGSSVCGSVDRKNLVSFQRKPEGSLQKSVKYHQNHTKQCMRGASWWLSGKESLANAGDMDSTPIWKDPTCWGATKPMCHNYWACALEPGSSNNRTFVLPLLRSLCPTAHALQ